MNSGHICTAPDHVLVWPEVTDELVRHLVEATHEFYGDDPKKSPDCGRVINRRNFDRFVGLLGSGKEVAGGRSDPAELHIAPTVLVDVSLDSPIMQEEVFGPILPVLEIESVEAVIQWVNDRPTPLGLYVFAEDLDVVERILNNTRRATRRLMIAPSTLSFPSFRSVAWGTPEWANTMAGGDSRRSPMRAVPSITAQSWIPAYVTRPTQNTLERRLISKLTA
jgi:Aldehyde dehydrogenase family